MTWLVGNPRFSLVVENRFWLVNGAGPIRPWSDFVGRDHVSRGWEQWGVSRTRLSWPMCWVLGAWFNMAKNSVLLCKVPVDKRCVLSWTGVIIYAGRIVPCLHWYLIRVIGRMTSLEWFSLWETSNNIINFNDVRKRLWKFIWLSRVFLLEIMVDWKGLYAHSNWRPDSLKHVLLLLVDLLGDARDHLVSRAVWILERRGAQ